MGNLLDVHVHAANIHDTKGGCYVFAKTMRQYPTIKAVCADAGYRGTFKRLIEQFFKVRVDISKQIMPQFEVLPKRWRVERTFAWMAHSRRLSKDYEISAKSSAAMVKISHIHSLIKRF